MNPFNFKDVFVGRNDDKERVYVDVDWDGKRLSFIGTVLRAHQPRNAPNPEACGQVGDYVRDVDPRLAELWARWHLNDMRAGCEHQEARFRAGEPRPTFKNDYAGMDVPCPDCGYKYGHAWKVEEVPEQVLSEIHQIMTRHARR